MKSQGGGSMKKEFFPFLASRFPLLFPSIVKIMLKMTKKGIPRVRVHNPFSIFAVAKYAKTIN